MTRDPTLAGLPAVRPESVRDRYEWLERIAWREEREVWRARQLWPPRPVALKVSRDLDALRREAAALVRVGPPAVPAVIEVGELPAADALVPALVLEWIDGLPFDDATRALSQDDRLDHLARLADAVEAIHEAGLVHGDLKPANIRVAGDGEIRVLDLGAAGPLDGGLEGGVESGALSLAYAAPERALGAPASVASDVFALGVLLYEQLTGARPWRAEEARGPAALRMALLGSDPAPPRLLVPRLSASLEAVALRALAPAPRRRYASAAAFAADLRRARRGEPVLARRPGAAERIRDYLRRRPRQAASFGAIAVSLLALLASSITGTLQARAALRRAEAVRSPLDRAGTLLLDQVEVLDLRSGTLAARTRWIDFAERTIHGPGAAQAEREGCEVGARLHKLVGDLLDEQGEKGRATEHYALALELYSALYAQSPNPAHGGGQSVCQVRIGDLAKERGDLATTADCYRCSFRLDEELHRRFPASLTLLDNLGYSHERVGDLAMTFGDTAGAKRHFEERRRIAEEVYLHEPTPHRAFALIASEGLLAGVAHQEGRYEDEFSHLCRSYRWGEWILERTPNDRKVLLRHAVNATLLARALVERPETSRGCECVMLMPELLLGYACTTAWRIHRKDPHDRESLQILENSRTARDRLGFGEGGARRGIR